MSCVKCGNVLENSSPRCPHCGFVSASTIENTSPPALPTDPRIGLILDDKYQLIRLLGSGGMGRVYRARRLRLGDDVAIKILHQQVDNPDARRRFEREARAAANLSHPNIVVIHDFEDGKGAASLAYIVMELLEGTPLNEILADEKRMNPERATTLMGEVCAGVSFAHSRGVIHRDIKPQNLIVLPKGSGRGNETVKIVDFGLAKLRPSELGTAADSLTPWGSRLGTPLYMSPEACEGKELDARADIYSLGATMYHMLAGRPPFVATSNVDLQWKHVHEQPPRLPGEGLAMRALELVTARALEKNPERRQQDARTFADELLKALESPSAKQTRGPEKITKSIESLLKRQDSGIDSRASRAKMLSNVRRIWIDGALANMRALFGEPFRIGIQVSNDFRSLTRAPSSARLVSPQADVLELFDNADHQLLILGDAGAGKTFKMLELLDSLLKRADQNSFVPIPVVFNLSSWARRGEPMAEWLTSELSVVYGVPHKLARQWVAGEKLALFLDGLDEITAAGAEPGSDQEEDAQKLTVNCRRKCLEKLNAYIAQTDIWLVLCCREKEFAALGTRLETRGENTTGRILPLTDDQVEIYLSSAGTKLAFLREAMAQDEELRQLARTPFLLTTMAIAYQHATTMVIIDGGKGGLQARLKHMFEKYVGVCHERTESAKAKRYSLRDIRHYLGELAQKMEEGGSKVLLVEQLQPDWLPPSGHRLYVAFVCLLLVLATWLLIGLPAGWAIGYERADSSSILARLFQFNSQSMIVMTLSSASFISLGFAFSKSWGFGIAWGLNLGVARAIIIGMGKGPDRFQPERLILAALENRHSWLWQGLVTVALGILVLTPLMKVRGHARDKIYPFERRRLEMRSALWGVISVLTVGVVFLVLFGPLRGLAFGIALTLILVLGFGYRRTRFEIRAYPNQGIWQSGFIALKTGLVAALTGLICFGVSYGSFLNRDHGVVNGILGLTLAVTSLWFGGMPWIQHMGLRLALARCGLAPLNLVGFLNAATELRLLRRVGGSYIFQHEYLRTYFREQRASNLRSTQ